MARLPKESTSWFFTKDLEETNEKHRVNFDKQEMSVPHAAFLKNSTLVYVDADNNLCASQLTKKKSVSIPLTEEVSYLGVKDEELILLGYKDGEAEVYLCSEINKPIRILSTRGT